MKYELTDETIDVSGTTLHRIKALKDFGNVKKGELGGYVKKGELGGYVESEYNLSQIGNCWVYGNARVCGDAEVCGNAKVCGNADYITIKGLGSRYRDTTIFKTRNEDVVVRCGCFYGTLTEFVNEVGITHGDSKYAKEYLALVELAKIHFGIEK